MRNTASLLKKVMVASALAGATFLVSCKSDLETVKAISNFENKPSETMDNFRSVYTQGGKPRMIVSAPYVQRYSLKKEPFSEFNKGIKAESFNEAGALVASITANYAIYHENQKLWEARGNVVGKNSKGETLYTEKLYWNEQTRRVSSDVFVKVVRADGSTSTGEGIDADEKFQDYNVKKPKMSGFSF
ncbi:LPS export ABC transporter periplasmic protein LptC [Alistipes sp. ZOR0009]|jgi:LPS export ABC transporter protein LptC|uniref:LPS export ABC transporter periplasmic protein LptC n=1 Tax=Alistipes sp. ZOR0009 TaxID=1339253 RepID=UPI0006893605|nr:LPS export ABC transporter periplasmic protein LptC [Alistipes sp. ZOR0009]